MKRYCDVQSLNLQMPPRTQENATKGVFCIVQVCKNRTESVEVECPVSNPDTTRYYWNKRPANRQGRNTVFSNRSNLEPLKKIFIG